MKEYVLYFKRKGKCTEKIFTSVDKLSSYIKRYIGIPKDYTTTKGPNYFRYKIEIESLIECNKFFISVYVS